MNKKSNYDRFPVTYVKGFNNMAWQGYENICAQLLNEVNARNSEVTVITVECYPGVRESEVLTALKDRLNPVLIINADSVSLSGEEITEKIKYNLTDDRVFGVMYHGEIEEFFNNQEVEKCRENISRVNKGLVLVYGVGATVIHKGDILVYADMARWEIQQRYRSGELANWKMNNYDEDILRKYKRGYFIEWRIADRLKKRLFNKMDYVLDTNVSDVSKMVKVEAFFAGLSQTIENPFRVVPYFDPGVWGGQWMKKVCGLDADKANYAWSFDGVPEENSLYLQYGDIRLEVPSINLVFNYPIKLLGNKVHARFGTEFPIRFDFLDTMEGQNLSLQVHPLTEYTQDTFGMHYTQDESYYILDAKPDAVVYLGVKTGVKPEEMLNALEQAQKGENSFPAEQFVNILPAKKHDHFLIPAGTVHCSGKNCMVLEISATPYIFTFKLWDWDRLGLDGLPRPVHLEHGSKNIQFDRDTKWVMENLVGQTHLLETGDGYTIEKTGLHEREFIETRRYWFEKPVTLYTNGSVNMLNLVEGESIEVISPSASFEPFEVHYAETFIIPAHLEEYKLVPKTGGKWGVIQAYVRV